MLLSFITKAVLQATEIVHKRLFIYNLDHAHQEHTLYKFAIEQLQEGRKQNDLISQETLTTYILCFVVQCALPWQPAGMQLTHNA